MSEAGYRSARDVMRLNEHALEITGKPEEYSEWFYWVSIFGNPSPDEPWGWQIDGHHLNLNCFVLGRSACDDARLSWALSRCWRASASMPARACSQRKRSRDMR